SFNPPHVAHQMACLYVLETQPVDHLVCLPAFKHPFEKALAPFGDRVEMCRLLVAPLGERASVSTLEREVGDGRTLVVVEALRAREPAAALRFVIGADILRERDKWYRWADLERLAPPIVLGRRGFPGPDGVELPEISSTEIRARLTRGASVDGLVPRTILQYLHQKGLY